MSTLINFMRKNTKGYISINTVIIGGLIVGAGAVTIGLFQDNSLIQINNANTAVTEHLDNPNVWKH